MSVMQRQDVIEIRFYPEKASRGLYVEPEPLLDDCAPVIVVQRNEFLVGRWEEDCFCHPANQQELASDAETAVRSMFPDESFTSNEFRVFTCPPEVAERF